MIINGFSRSDGIGEILSNKLRIKRGTDGKIVINEDGDTIHLTTFSYTANTTLTGKMITGGNTRTAQISQITCNIPSQYYGVPFSIVATRSIYEEFKFGTSTSSMTTSTLTGVWEAGPFENFLGAVSSSYRDNSASTTINLGTGDYLFGSTSGMTVTLSKEHVVTPSHPLIIGWGIYDTSSSSINTIYMTAPQTFTITVNAVFRSMWPRDY